MTKRKMQRCSSVAAITPTDLYLSMSTRNLSRETALPAGKQGRAVACPTFTCESKARRNDLATSVRCSASRTLGKPAV